MENSEDESKPSHDAPSRDVEVTEIVERPNRKRGRVEIQREEVRWYVARGLIVVLGIAVVLLAALLIFSEDATVEDATASFNTIITGLFTLVGSAVGFYFGSEKSGSGRDEGGEE